MRKLEEETSEMDEEIQTLPNDYNQRYQRMTLEFTEYSSPLVT